MNKKTVIAFLINWCSLIIWLGWSNIIKPDTSFIVIVISFCTYLINDRINKFN